MNNQFVTEEELTDMLDDKKGYLHDQVNEMNDAIKATPEYKLGKKLLDGEISNLTTKNIIDNDSEPTTADEHNKEWLDDDVHMIRAKKFTNSMRGHLILSQALTYGIRHLKKLENRKNPFPLKGEHAEPSNRADMEYIKEHLFPLYDIFNTDQ